MQIRDRIKELRRVKAGALRPNPLNWRTHPPEQRDALRGVLAEIGYAGALLARELEDGSLELIDGHLRAETTPDQDVPVLVLDVDASEAAKLLATLDPLAAMAGADATLVAELLKNVRTGNAAVQALLDSLADEPELPALPDVDPAPEEAVLRESFQIVVQCRDEDEQRELYERLQREGHTCRVLTL